MTATSITTSRSDDFRNAFQKKDAQKLIQNAVIKSGIQSATINPDALIRNQHTFSHELESGKITEQKLSGRCWLFAGMNMLRQSVMKELKLKSFEFSSNYPLFWDKFEKSNYFLENIIQTQKEPLTGRLVSHLLTDPLQDGGQWDMFRNLLEKYGAVPKYIMPETFHSGNTRIMNHLLTLKLREFSVKIRKSKSSPEELRLQKESMLRTIYDMLCVFLGTPPTKFNFEYLDKDEQYHEDLNLTPLSFLKKYPGVNLSNYASIINAPTPDKPLNQTFTVKFLGNIIEGHPILYLNLKHDDLSELTKTQLQADEPVWFGCDVGKFLAVEDGVMDPDVFSYEPALNTTFTLSKGDRIDYGESKLTHAMLLTGLHEQNKEVTRWKVENSWGEKNVLGKSIGKKGFFVMSDRWFSEFTYQVVINKKHLTGDQKECLRKKPIELEPWDPLGALALMQ